MKKIAVYAKRHWIIMLTLIGAALVLINAPSDNPESSLLPARAVHVNPSTIRTSTAIVEPLEKISASTCNDPSFLEVHTQSKLLSSKAKENHAPIDIFSMDLSPPPPVAAPLPPKQLAIAKPTLVNLVAPPKPIIVTPSFPYAIIGTWNEGGHSQLIFSRENTVTQVKEKDIVDHIFEFNHIDSHQIDYTYIPTGVRQTIYLSVGS